MAIYLRGKFLRYRFRFAGKQIDESTKTTSKTIAREAERQHRRALEAGYNNFKELRENRVRGGAVMEWVDRLPTGGNGRRPQPADPSPNSVPHCGVFTFLAPRSKHCKERCLKLVSDGASAPNQSQPVDFLIEYRSARSFLISSDSWSPATPAEAGKVASHEPRVLDADSGSTPISKLDEQFRQQQKLNAPKWTKWADKQIETSICDVRQWSNETVIAYGSFGLLMPHQDVATGRPITPLHGGHVGLLCTAGLLNGVFGQGEDRHIARWRSVKHVTTFVEQDGDAEIIHHRERWANELYLVYADGRTLKLTETPAKKEGEADGERTPAARAA